MGADDYHVSVDFYKQTRSKREREIIEKYKRIELLAYKYLDGQIEDKRLAEAVAGIVNEEVII